MKNLILSALVCSALFAVSCKKDKEPAPPIKDADGNVYTEIKIGMQTWLAENLKATKFRNGDLIPNLGDFTAWKNTTAAAYCNYDNDATIGITEGRLYNWFAATDSRNICPPGYHIPTATELQTLIDFLGGNSIAGGKLKMTGETYWTGNTGATNETGFSAMGAGARNTEVIADLDFVHRKVLGIFWSSTPVMNAGFENYARYLHLQYNMVATNLSLHEKTLGMSVRCIKD